ncbi:hypothetical protein ACFLIM_20895 [Nonomuraea sp. M3C6]|uniref:Uncharacterized protein n=1 Tax=Nonomuraea marmarensis TaxID=3351344 RepID=A0ABW7AH56_9ACTN
MLSDLALAAKGFWGYDQAFIESCRDELAFGPDDIARRHFMVADLGGLVAGCYSVDGDPPAKVVLPVGSSTFTSGLWPAPLTGGMTATGRSGGRGACVRTVFRSYPSAGRQGEARSFRTSYEVVARGRRLAMTVLLQEPFRGVLCGLRPSPPDSDLPEQPGKEPDFISDHPRQRS